MRSPHTHRALLAALLAAAGCRSLFPTPPTDAVRRQQQDAVAYLSHPITVGQLVIHADFLLPADHRLIRELVTERELIANRLAMPPGEAPIHIYLFEDQAAYQREVAARFPDFPERRAIFVDSGAQLAVYAHWNDAVAEDLRHEVAHGYLHAALGELPLWLDEGLAEYFEVSRGRRGVNQEHVDLLVGKLAVAAWQPDLARLEQLTSAPHMTQLDYAESWLWVHFLLESSPDRAALLINHLATLNAAPPTPLSQALPEPRSQTETALVHHLLSFER